MVDWKTLGLVGGVLAVLAAATTIGQILKRQPDSGLNAAAVQTFNLRLRLVVDALRAGRRVPVG